MAFESGAAVGDLIALDTEGIFNLTVYAEDDSGNSAIEIGDPLYIRAGGLIGAATGDGTGDAEISKIRNLVTQVAFGYALGSMVAGGSGVIAVKVHWDPEEQQDEFGIFQDGHGADNLKSFTLIDQDDPATGYVRVLALSLTSTANRTGDATLTGLNIDMAAGGNVPYFYGIEIYSAVIADKTMGLVCGLSMYFEDQGNAVGNYCMVDLGQDNVHAAIGRDTYFRIREHGTIQGDKSWLLLEGANAVGYIWNFNDAAGAENGGFVLEPHSDTETSDYRVRVRLGNIAGDRYIYLYPV